MTTMFKTVKRGIRNALRGLGYELVWTKSINPLDTYLPAVHPDFDDSTAALCRYVQPFTMTSKERIFSLSKSIEYIVKHDVPGDIVECGVWKGGSMMAVARTLMELGARRRLHLFDTFEGMSPPTDVDVNVYGWKAADRVVAVLKETNEPMNYAPLDEVKCNLRLTGYDEGLIAFVQGKVEETIPASAPDRIALLRLDTDWFESTYHELNHLYPRLSVGGVLILDDYGHWQGSRKAVDQYIDEHNLKVLLHRIDYSARICVKLEA
jgi:hypothetical protein